LQFVGHEHLIQGFDARTLQTARARGDEGIDVEDPGLRMRQERVHEKDRRRDHQHLFHGDDQSPTIETVREHATIESEHNQWQKLR
jgi:CBS-domain-containing membrane protein